MNNRPTPETDGLWHTLNTGNRQPGWWVVAEKMRNHSHKLERERDEAKELAQAFHSDQVTLLLERDEAREKYDIEATEHMLAVNKLCGERDKAREDATNYYAKIGELEHELNNMQDQRDLAMRVIARLEQEREEARMKLAKITEAAAAVVDRWEQPVWKDVEPTAVVIYKLRDALEREAE